MIEWLKMKVTGLMGDGEGSEKRSDGPWGLTGWKAPPRMTLSPMSGNEASILHNVTFIARIKTVNVNWNNDKVAWVVYQRKSYMRMHLVEAAVLGRSRWKGSIRSRASWYLWQHPSEAYIVRRSVWCPPALRLRLGLATKRVELRTISVAFRSPYDPVLEAELFW